MQEEQQTLNGAGTGLQSLEVHYSPILFTHNGRPMAYRGSTTIYTADMGTLAESDFMEPADFKNEIGIRLSAWNIGEALRQIRKYNLSGSGSEREPAFLSVKCTSSFADLPDVYDRIREMGARYGVRKLNALCLEFPHKMLYRATTNARKTVMDMKVLGVKTMISGAGSEDCPVSKLLNIPVDYAILDSYTTSMVGNKEKPEFFTDFLRYLRSMNVKTIASGVTSDEMLKALSDANCEWALLSKSYEGTSEETDDSLTAEEALKKRGGDD